MKEQSNKENDRQESTSYAGLGISIGAALGLIFGMMLFDNLALGIGVGVSLGLIFGAAMDSQKNKSR